MINLSQVNCSNIEIKSETISDFITVPANYTELEIKAKLNCCDSEEVTATITEDDIAAREWTLDFPTTSSLEISGIYFENIYLGEEYNILSSPLLVSDYSCSTGTIANLYPIIQAWFTTNFGVTVTQSYVYDAVTNTCQYTIGNLPSPIRPLKITITRDGVEEDIFFSFFPVENISITSSAIIIDPELFGLESFVDGIYSFTITYRTAEGDIIIESSCIFFDCETKCKVSTALEDLLKCEKTATNIFLLHYSLTEGSNCGCNCEELCTIFTKLCNELKLIETNENCTSCGC